MSHRKKGPPQGSFCFWIGRSHRSTCCPAAGLSFLPLRLLALLLLLLSVEPVLQGRHIGAASNTEYAPAAGDRKRKFSDASGRQRYTGTMPISVVTDVLIVRVKCSLNARIGDFCTQRKVFGPHHLEVIPDCDIDLLLMEYPIIVRRRNERTIDLDLQDT